jgi:hypothetical protein
MLEGMSPRADVPPTRLCPHVAWRDDELPAAGAAAVLDIVLRHAAVAPGDAPSEGALESAPAR